MRDSRRPYPSDLSDAEWALLAPLLPPPAARGRPRKWPPRLVADAVFYLLRTGCAWRMLPREFPPWPTVFAHFRRWRRDGTLRRAHDALRGQVRLREGRAADATAGVIDSQSAKTTGVGGPERGYDGAKRLKGRKRHVLVDAAGLVLLACVHGADVQDRAGARRLVETARSGERPRMQLVWADQGYTGAFASWLHNARVAPRGRPPSGDAALAPRGRGLPKGGVPRAPAAVGRRAHVRVARAVAPVEQELRADPGQQRGDDLRREVPPDAAPPRAPSRLTACAGLASVASP